MKSSLIVCRILVALCMCGLVLPLAPGPKHHYPKSIVEYEVRKDLYTNETVSRGRLHLVNYDVTKRVVEDSEERRSQMVNFATFQRHLQCASPEPELDGIRGSWSLMQMAPPTKQSIERICAWAETSCHPWVQCREKVEEMKNGKYDHSKASDVFVNRWGGFKNPTLLRVINNTLHYDWPWGIERFTVSDGEFRNRIVDHYLIMDTVLHLVSDIGDSVFMFGLERAFLPWNLPFPMFSFAPSLSSADLPYPWPESYRYEGKMYHAAQEANDFSDAFYRGDHRPWDERDPRAAFFASFTSFRQVAFDSAALRPDLFDASCAPDNIAPWNPLSDEPELSRLWGKPSAEHNATARKHPGFLDPILKFGDGRRYTPQNYKYVIVPTGLNDQSTSGRLAAVLAHSGAVVLLQENSFSYHFSARLEPWVHYVPLSHSMADVIDKVEWLKRNDDMAQQIVKNAQNFALSYLRMEDYLCYAAGSLRLLHELEKTTDALEGFSPVKIERKRR